MPRRQIGHGLAPHRPSPEHSAFFSAIPTGAVSKTHVWDSFNRGITYAFSIGKGLLVQDQWGQDGDPAQRAVAADACLPVTKSLTALCVDDVGVDGAAVAIMTDAARSRDLLCATDSVAARIDELQFTIGEGPCMDAFVGGESITTSDIGEQTAAARWPAFSSELLDEVGVRGIFAYPIFAGGAQLGVLELYRRQNTALTSSQNTAAHVLTIRLGAVVLSELETYRWSLDPTQYPRWEGSYRFARADVHAAVGMLSVRWKTSPADAGLRLRARAYAESRSISSMARDIVHRHGQLADEDAS